MSGYFFSMVIRGQLLNARNKSSSRKKEVLFDCGSGSKLVMCVDVRIN